jgi:hypothetical protein
MLMAHNLNGSNYVVYHHDNHGFKLDVVEEMYKAKYVGEFTLRTKGGWANLPVAVFYTKEKHPEGSNYFGLFIDPFRGALITNAISAVENVWNGVLNPETGEVLYSAYRHDYQTHGNLMADGGPEYLRSSMHPVVQFQIKDGTLHYIQPKEGDNDGPRNLGSGAALHRPNVPRANRNSVATRPPANMLHHAGLVSA